MYLKKSFNKKRNKTQLSFVQGYRKDGKVKHKVIKNLGYLEDYLDEYDDPVAHFQQIAKEWNATQEVPETIEVRLSDKLPDQCCNRKNLGYAIVKIISASHWMMSTGHLVISADIHRNSKNICIQEFPTLLAGILKKPIMMSRTTTLKFHMKMRTVRIRRGT